METDSFKAYGITRAFSLVCGPWACVLPIERHLDVLVSSRCRLLMESLGGYSLSGLS